MEMFKEVIRGPVNVESKKSNDSVRARPLLVARCDARCRLKPISG